MNRDLLVVKYKEVTVKNTINLNLMLINMLLISHEQIT